MYSQVSMREALLFVAMTDSDRTSIYAPTYVANRLEQLHQDRAREGAPKYDTLRRALSAFAEQTQEGSADE